MKPLKTKITKKTLEHARDVARYFGAEAYCNDNLGINEYKDDMAYKDWASMPMDLRSDATHQFLEGKRLEKREG
jgi:hypothetical protein